MFEIEEKKFIFEDYPENELTVHCRKGTLDYDLLKAVKEYELDDIGYRNGDTIVDLGSHNGGEILWFIARKQPLRIFAFEPIFENFDMLWKNIARNNSLCDIKAFQIAVGGQTKLKEKIHYGDLNYKKEGGTWGKKYYFMGNIRKPYRDKDKFEEVYMINLDKLFLDNNIKHCRLLRMDVEGNEKEILESASIDTLSRIDWIIGEYHNPYRREDLLEHTKGLFDDVVYKKDSKSAYLFRFKANRFREDIIKKIL